MREDGVERATFAAVAVALAVVAARPVADALRAGVSRRLGQRLQDGDVRRPVLQPRPDAPPAPRTDLSGRMDVERRELDAVSAAGDDVLDVAASFGPDRRSSRPSRRPVPVPRQGGDEREERRSPRPPRRATPLRPPCAASSHPPCAASSRPPRIPARPRPPEDHDAAPAPAVDARAAWLEEVRARQREARARQAVARQELRLHAILTEDAERWATWQAHEQARREADEASREAAQAEITFDELPSDLARIAIPVERVQPVPMFAPRHRPPVRATAPVSLAAAVALLVAATAAERPSEVPGLLGHGAGAGGGSIAAGADAGTRAVAAAATGDRDLHARERGEAVPPTPTLSFTADLLPITGDGGRDELAFAPPAVQPARPRRGAFDADEARAPGRPPTPPAADTEAEADDVRPAARTPSARPDGERDQPQGTGGQRRDPGGATGRAGAAGSERTARGGTERPRDPSDRRGDRVTLRALMQAIAQLESRGSYTARNRRTGARGKYQWLPYVWRADAARVLGDRRAPMTPANQERVARYAIGRLLRRFDGDWRLVALAWHRGTGGAERYVRRNPRTWHRYEYVRIVARHLGRSASRP